MVSAQEVNFGQPAVQIVSITINENGDAHVIHTVQPSDNARQLNVIRDNFTNLQITDEDGESIEYAETSGTTTGFLFFPSREKTYVEYDLADAVSQKNGMWRWDYLYLASTEFYFPEKTVLVFANGSPIRMVDQEGVRCHGCQLTLEYPLDRKEQVKQVEWEDKKFDVRIITNAEISSFEFDQPNKKISLDVSETNQYVTMIIPKELLWNPYEVFLNEKQLLKKEFYSDEEFVWLGLKSNATGTVEVIGVSAVPEFPIAAVLVLGVAMIFAAKYANKFSLR